MRILYTLSLALLLSACVPETEVNVPDPQPEPSSGYLITLDIPVSDPAPLAARSYQMKSAGGPAATFHLVDVDHTTGKITKVGQIDNASQQGDGKWMVQVNSNPNAASFIIAHENNGNAPVICINCDLPDGTVYAPLVEEELTVDVLSTVASDSFLGTVPEELSLDDTTTLVQGVQSLVAPDPVGDETLDQYIADVEEQLEPEVDRVVFDVTKIPTNPLNDTGYTTCADYSNNILYNGLSITIDCAASGATIDGDGFDLDGDPVPGAQDAFYGRDIDPTTNDPSDGYAGFSWIKLGADGQPLAIQDQPWDNLGSEAAGTQWSCIHDTVTLRTWEVKSPSGLRSGTNTYSWYHSDAFVNRGAPGTANGGSCAGGILCNTEAYAQEINSQSLCGYTDWRLPTTEEMLNIARLDVHPNHDTAYFPHTGITEYWTYDTDTADITDAWYYSTDTSFSGRYAKSLAARVRLVRLD